MLDGMIQHAADSVMQGWAMVVGRDQNGRGQFHRLELTYDESQFQTFHRCAPFQSSSRFRRFPGQLKHPTVNHWERLEHRNLPCARTIGTAGTTEPFAVLERLERFDRSAAVERLERVRPV